MEWKNRNNFRAPPYVPTSPRVVFIPILSNMSVKKVIEPLGINLGHWNLNLSIQIGCSLSDWPGFSKMAVTSSLHRIFTLRLLRWKLDFRVYNLGSRIYSFGHFKPEIIPFEVDQSWLQNCRNYALTVDHYFDHNFFNTFSLIIILVPLEI